MYYPEREKPLLVRVKLLRLFFLGNGAADGVEVGIRVKESLGKELPRWLPTCVGTLRKHLKNSVSKKHCKNLLL